MSQPENAITQRHAKVLIRDYLRETGKRGVTSLVRDMSRHAKRPIFTQRAFEQWLFNQARSMQDDNWAVVQNFIQSDAFKRFVPYANEGPEEKRLKQVAEGFLALYGTTTNPLGLYLKPSTIEENGCKAVSLLDGCWENVPNQLDGDVPRTICKVTSIRGKRYAKVAYIALFRSKQISTTGLLIYLNSDEREDSEYCHNFVLQLWRRRDPESDSKMPGGLYHLKLGKNQPEFAISKMINQYFYKEPDPIGARGDVNFALEPDLESAKYKKAGSFAKARTFGWAKDASLKSAVILRASRDPIPEETMIIDSLLEDVLPHGLAEA